jgi:hypothetical protein
VQNRAMGDGVCYQLTSQSQCVKGRLGDWPKFTQASATRWLPLMGANVNIFA